MLDIKIYHLRLVATIVFVLSFLSLSGQDTLAVVKDTIPDNIRRQPGKSSYGIQYTLSDDAIDQNIKYGATDSTWVNVPNKTIQLFGKAYMDYESYKLNAEYIKLDFGKNLAFAGESKDSVTQVLGKTLFDDGDRKIKADALKFNYETKKGLVRGSEIKEGEFIIHGELTKFIKGDEKRSIHDLIFQKNALITTCNHPHPHYGIRTRKIKIIPNKVAVIGFSQLEIAGVPTPLFLPYGLFPMVKGQSSGLIFPRKYEYDEELGFGLKGIGYYFPINDYVDLTLTGNIFTRGSHMIALASNYKKRYKYTGNAFLSYSNELRENPETGRIFSNKSFSLRLTHNQAAKAHPYRNFGGTINIQTGNYLARNNSSYDSQVRNILRSNFSYRDDLPGTPFNLTMGFNHSQNTQTHQMSVSFPTINLRMQTLYPFRNKNKASSQYKWYDNVTLTYSADLKNYVNTVDTTFFTQETLDKMVTGAKQNAGMAVNFKVMKYFDLSPSINATQIIAYKTKDIRLNETPVIDTIGTSVDQDGNLVYETAERYEIDESFKTGIKTHNSWNAGVRLSTNIFGVKKWQKGWLRGVRHKMSPSVSVSYSSPTDRYLRSYYTDPDSLETQLRTYNIFQGGAYTGAASKRSLSLNYGINNIIEGKYYSKKDEKEKTFQPLNNISINGSYNFEEDSLKWSPVRISTGAKLFKNITSVTFNASYDFYKQENNRRVNKTVWQEDGRLLELDNMTIGLSNRFSVSQLVDLFSKKPESKTKKQNRNEESDNVLLDDVGRLIDRPSPQEKTKNVDERTFYDYIRNFSLTHSWRYSIRRKNGIRESGPSTHTIRLTGSFPLTDNWDVRIGNISYDLLKKKFVYPDFGLERDLHCWNMSFNWQPAYGTYGFFIRVRSTNLSFLKYNYGQSNGRFF